MGKTGPQYLVAKEFSTAEWWKSWKSFHKKVCRKAKKMLDRTPYCAIYCWIASLSPFWDQKYPIIGDEFLRRIQPWRELFSPRSVSARKFMAFWPAWAPRTAVRSSMLAVQRAARAWLSDLSPRGNGSAQNWTCAKDRWYWIGGLLFYPIVRFN